MHWTDTISQDVPHMLNQFEKLFLKNSCTCCTDEKGDEHCHFVKTFWHLPTFKTITLFFIFIFTTSSRLNSYENDIILTYNIVIPAKVTLLHFDDSGISITRTLHVQQYKVACSLCMTSKCVNSQTFTEWLWSRALSNWKTIHFFSMISRKGPVLENSINNTQSILSDSVEQLGQWNSAKAMVLHQCILQ